LNNSLSLIGIKMIVDKMTKFLFPLVSMINMDWRDFVVDYYNIETFDTAI
jgi:superfamily II helicase